MRGRSFLVEGVRAIEAALDSGADPSLVLFAIDAPAENPRLAALLARVPRSVCWDALPAMIEFATDTVTPQGIVAAFPILDHPVPRSGLVLVADAVSDPGNVGTLLRTAAAAGAAGFAYLPGTADPYSPKVVRAGMGAHWQIPISRLTVEELGADAARGGWLAVSRDGIPYDQADWQPDGYLVVGSEAWGTRPAVASLGFNRVTVPLAAGVDSLNSAIAGAVLLFEARRQAGSLVPAGPRARPAGRKPFRN